MPREADLAKREEQAVQHGEQANVPGELDVEAGQKKAEEALKAKAHDLVPAKGQRDRLRTRR